jgi:hypothetical protein
MAKPRRKDARQTGRPVPKARPADAGQTLQLFPHELRPGDRLMIGDQAWEVADNPASYRMGKMLEVRLHKPGDPSAMTTEHWPAHQRIAVSRA